MTTYTDAQRLWPVSNGESLNCSGIGGTPILPIGNNSRVCGVQTNRTLAERCCGSAEISEYQCWLYCDSTQSLSEWARCVVPSNATAVSWGPFCQGELIPNNTETLTSSAFHSSAPKYTWMVIVLVFSFFFLGPAEATMIPSLDSALVRRQSGSGCSLTIDSNYTSLQHGSKRVSATFDCTNTAGAICAFEASVVTPLTENNRTLNGSSAAEPEFDAFFDVVSNSTDGRKFPAMSSVNITHGFVGMGPQIIALGWTPLHV